MTDQPNTLPDPELVEVLPDTRDALADVPVQQLVVEEPAATRADLIGQGRPVRWCIACGQADDHPRHAVQLDDGSGGFVDWHFDCHAMVTGCPTCSLTVETRPDGATGADFLAHVLDVGSRQAAAAGTED